MIVKIVQIGGESGVLLCDAKCEKAWGINNRPRQWLSSDEDDYVYLSDNALGLAPIDPGTYEGGDAKPTCVAERLNKWCHRECERCHTVFPGQENEPFDIPDLRHPQPNMLYRSEKNSGD